MSARRWLLRATGTAAVALAGVAGWASPASAHTLGGAPPTNYRSEITSVDPSVPGLAVSLLDLGRRVQLVNRSGADVEVLGYSREPYLRVGPKGVFQNRRSPAVYLNRLVPPGSPAPRVPPTANSAAPPLWHKVADGQTARWRDRRTRWEGSDPPAVRQRPTAVHAVVPRWTIELRGSDDIAVAGRILWVPGPPVGPWLALAAGLFVLPLAVATSRWWAPALSGCVAALVAVDVVHAFAGAAPAGDPVALLAVKVLLGGLLLTAAWGVGAWSVSALQQRREAGVMGAGIAGLLIAVLSGVTDAPSLSRSQVPFAFPAIVARTAVATALGLGSGLAAAAVVVLRRLRARGAEVGAR